MEKQNMKAWLYLLPAFLFLGAFMIYPLIDVFVYSFEEGYNSASQTFYGIGMYNYSYVLHDPYFLQALKNTFILVIITVPVSTGLALLISAALSSIKPLRDLFQTIFFLPYVTNTLAVGLVFMILFKKTPYSDGLINLLIQFFGGSSVDFCAIINARSGHCQEDCKFCAQSGWYRTGAKVYRLLPEEQIIEAAKKATDAAKKAKAAGAVRFSIVTGGRNQDNPNEFEEIIAIVKRIRKEVGIEVCCSLGLISSAQALRLKEAGITRIHCNIETSPSYFPEICTTHTMEDKEDIISTAQKAGIRVCSGGIIGLGESLDQRVEMAFKLKEMHIDSVPLNILNPVKGTPFYDNKRPSALEILRTFAMFRFVLPKALIRTAGGREVNLRSLQAHALSGGLNGIMVGGYLTTGGRDPKEDLVMTADLGRSRTSPQL